MRGGRATSVGALVAVWLAFLAAAAWAAAGRALPGRGEAELELHGRALYGMRPFATAARFATRANDVHVVVTPVRDLETVVVRGSRWNVGRAREVLTKKAIVVRPVEPRCA